MKKQAVGKIPVKPIVVDVNGLNIAFDMSLLKNNLYNKMVPTRQTFIIQFKIVDVNNNLFNHS
jgi:hypothetical protein